MDAPRMLFEDLKANGMARLRKWIEEGRQEDLYLEFKTAESPMVTSDKQNLAAGVSGFANSEGGVIVWGVVAAKDKEQQIDVATDLRPIRGLRRFLSNLTEYVTRLVVPAAQGVEHLAIPDPDHDDAGYAVTLVPKAQGLPHMATAQSQHRYYYRAGDSFLAMEHFMLADRFGRRPQPKLSLVWRFENDAEHTCVIVGVKNEGRGLALYPALHLEERPPDDIRFLPVDQRRHDGYGLPENDRTLRWTSTRWRMFSGRSDYVIYPGTNLDVAMIKWVVPRTGDVVPRDMRIRYALHCDGFSVPDATEVIGGGAIIAFAQGRW